MTWLIIGALDLLGCTRETYTKHLGFGAYSGIVFDESWRRLGASA